MKKTGLFVLLFAAHIYSWAQTGGRTVVSLNGTWEIGEGKMNEVPQSFKSTVPVPGLVNLATPAFKEIGPKPVNRESFSQSDPLREAFWYRRKFTLNQTGFDTAILKIAKSMYNTKVIVNGQDVGNNIPCFTPGFFDVTRALKKGENEIIVRVGASRDAVPPEYPDGFDCEREHFIAGIYDDVSLTLTGSTFIRTVQAVPDIHYNRVGVQLNIINSGPKKNVKVMYTVREVKTNKIVGSLEKNEEISGNFTSYVKVPISNMHLWSPEDPFLYKLEVSTDNDNVHTPFGMRSFYFDQVTRVGQLNSKPYYLRGSNITLFRFFEDPLCKQLPWDKEWVRKFFKSFKQFHWNSMRICISRPPQFWYDIADEEGILLQDEFPIWFAEYPGHEWPLNADLLAKECTLWMEENWNHPSVAIWDMSNETVDWVNDNVLGRTIWKIRHLDLSQRPWDNSYTRVRTSNDVLETHPYHFLDPHFKLKDLANIDTIPPVHPLIPNRELSPIILNEYGWLWLNRDGTPTTLTREVYKNLLGENATPDQRRHLYYTYMAAETEWWRCHRKLAGVLSFCVLSHSRSDGQTSDYFRNPTTLEYDPECLKYFPDAFSPVGLMLNEWGQDIKTGANHDFGIYTINDLGANWSGIAKIQILKNGKVVSERSVNHAIPAYGRYDIKIKCPTPKVTGVYDLVASLQGKDGKPIRSIREKIPFK